MRRTEIIYCSIVPALVGILPASTAFAADCSVTSVGFTPINDLSTGLYLNLYPGGLYPAGSNDVPVAHFLEGVARSNGLRPLDPNGNPSPAGKYVLMSMGMSNTTQEFCSASSFEPCDPWTFMGQAAADPEVNHSTLVFVNGARGGQTTVTWDDPADANYDRVLNEQLTPKELTEAQVQVLWIKLANPGPTVSLPAANADAYQLEAGMGNVVRAAKVRYPNLSVVFLSSRIYAGYATNTSTLNPEPYAYESGFAVKWLIEAQINQMNGGGADPIAGDLDYGTVAPWLAWGPYLWADGQVPRSDGLIWECADFAADGTHPATSGREKVGTMLLEFLLGSPFSMPWFRADTNSDCDTDADVDLVDYAQLADCLSGPDSVAGPPCGCVDLDRDGDTDMLDYMSFQFALTAPPVSLDPAVDDFERASLGPNWLVLSGMPGIIDNSDLGTLAAGIHFVAWQGSQFLPDQFCEGQIAAGWSSTDSLQLSVRLNPVTRTRYGLRWLGSSGVLDMRRFDVGGSVLLASVPGQTLNPGDVVRIDVQGSTIRGLINGSLVFSPSDSVLTGGTVGVAMSQEGSMPGPFLESWSGGSLPSFP
jgi:hypothetical protein